jgi:tRNA nucleotidyltransferase (CCA-adding enzyme)
MQITPKNFRRFLSKLGVDNFEGYMCIKRADMAGQSDYKIEHRKEQLKQLEDLYADVKEKAQGLYIKDLAIGGKDLMDMGVKQGRQIGEILNALLELVIEEPERNTREYLIKEAEKMIRTHKEK